MAVAVKVDAILDVGRREELRLPDLAGVSTDEIAQRQIAALENFQRCNQLGLEQLAAAAIMRQRGDRADHRQLAHVTRAVVALQSPNGHQQLFRYPKLSFDARKQ